MHIQEAYQLLLEWRDIAHKHTEEEVFSFFDYCLRNLGRSKAQVFQDLFVLHQLKNKEHGFFVDIGASDGVTLSNTYLLEKEYKWKGILVEPAHMWANDLKKNRSCGFDLRHVWKNILAKPSCSCVKGLKKGGSCELDFRCVWSASGQTVEFNEVKGGGLSTIDQFSSSDRFGPERRNGTKYKVETVSLVDLLKAHSAPKVIDYISIDTQGSEFDILNAFDFKAYDVKIFSIEHNFTPARERIFRLMLANGYERKLEIFSVFDDWYVKKA
jgi:FkbM family methyltransferase